jgi:hypothetical protein
VDDATYQEFQAKLSAVASPEDVERVAGELGAYAEAHPGDPDVPVVGEQLAMVRQARQRPNAPA